MLRDVTLDRKTTIAVVFLALIVRITAVWLVIGPDASDVYTYEHGEIAHNLLTGKGFSVRLLGTWGLTSQQAPTVPVLLAGCYAALGEGTSAAHWLFLLIQCIEGALTALGVVHLTRILTASLPVGIIAGCLTAIYPPLVYAVTHVQVAATACMQVVWIFLVLLMIRQKPTRRLAVTAGLLIGWAALTDPILVLTGVAVTISWVIFDRPSTRALRRQLLESWLILVVVSILIVTPWIIRGYGVHGRIVFVKSTFGYAFWQGNNRLSVGTDKVMRASVRQKLTEKSGSLSALDEKLWAARHEAGCVDDIALSNEEKQRLGRFPELERSEELYRRAKLELYAEPGRYTALCLRRMRYFLWIDESNPKTSNVIYQICQISISFLALSGFMMMSRFMRQKTSAIWLAFLMTTLFHSLTITAPRFHLPWEPLMIVIGVGGLHCAVIALRKRSFARFLEAASLTSCNTL